MNRFGSEERSPFEPQLPDGRVAMQKILVFQQNGSGESKIQGIRRYGNGMFSVEIIAIDEPLPLVIDDAGEYLPDEIDASLVLDFLKHPDISHDLAALCLKGGIPIIASGKKLRVPGVLAPPT